uniref:PLAT domain-containing protein n=1 Tax=Arion vulgaris TaxID=1028688 RepID=A0A0B7B8C8_9EUPU
MDHTGVFHICLILVIFLAKFSIANPINVVPATGADATKDGAGNTEALESANTKPQSIQAEEDLIGQVTPTCKISTKENLMGYIDLSEKEEKTTLFEFNIRMKNYSYDPFSNTTGLYFKPWLWYTTRSRHGRTLLLLSFHYDVLSMNILTIGVKRIEVALVDEPQGCFGQSTTEQQVKYIRMILLSRSNVGQTSSFGKSGREEFVCNHEIRNQNGDAEFVYNCCFKDMSGKLKCSTEGEDFWINILYVAITSVKILMFLFCPNFVPASVYSAAYMAAEYVVTLKQKLKMKLFVSDKTDANVKYKYRLTRADISEWYLFAEQVRALPYDEIIPVDITDLKIKVKGKRIIPENDPPTGLIRTIYDNLVRCKVKHLEAFTDCCESSIYASMENNFRNKISWHKFVQMFMKCFMLLMIPIPYYIRLFIYFKFEAEEITLRRTAIQKNGLGESFNFLRTNVIQYFTPTHGLFIASYILYFICAVALALTSKSFRGKLKDVARSALSDMNSVSQTGVLGIIIRFILFPFKRCGLLGFLIGPVYFVLALPLCTVVFALYCIPTVYLTFRLPFYARKILGTSATMAAAEKREKLLKMKQLGKKISKIDRFAHSGDGKRKGDKFIPDDTSFHGCETVKNIAIQLSCSIFCLCILYSIALIFAESIGLFVEVISFTMMGIIVNAGSVLKYVSMVLLVFVYMNDCYSNVYENYLTFNKTIIDDIIERTTADLRKIASMPSSQQANTAFHVKCVDEDKDLTPLLNLDVEKKEFRWKLGQLLLFLDCFDTPRIPLRLFQKLCQVRVHGAPGPVYINLIAATGKFMIIVVFLTFVMIVVMAFGNVYEMSNTNTTLATLAGGFVPMLLKNVLSSKGARLSLKTVSFKGQIDEIIGEYKQYWPLTDFLVSRSVEEENADEKENGKKEISDEHFEAEKMDKQVDSKNKSPNQKKNDEKSEESKPKFDAQSDYNKNRDLTRRQSENNKNGIIRSASLLATNKSFEDDDKVDLFIDLSVADTAGWSIAGSSESLPSETIMPGYFDPDKVLDEDEETQPSLSPKRETPLDYLREIPVMYQKTHMSEIYFIKYIQPYTLVIQVLTTTHNFMKIMCSRRHQDILRYPNTNL